MPGLGRALALWVGEGRRADEHVGAGRRGGDHLGGRGVSADDDLAARALLPHHLLFCNMLSTDSPALQLPEVGSELHAELLGQVGVELARTRVLHDRVADRRTAVPDLDRTHEVVLAAHPLPPGSSSCIVIS